MREMRGTLLGFAGMALLASGGAAVADPPAMVIEADMVRGIQKDMKGPGCVLNNQFKHGEEVVWRIRVIDARTGAPLDDKGLKSLEVKLPTGATAAAHFGGHPPPKPIDTFWTATWIVPADFPTGTLSYTVTATDMAGHTATFEPFKTAPSELTIVADTQ